MEQTEPLTAVARRQIRAALDRWIVEPTRPSAAAVEIDALIDPLLAALTFEPSVTEFTADLQEILRARTRLRPSWAECLGAARDILDGYRLLTITVIDAA